LSCDGRCRPHPLAKVLAGRKAAITLTSSGRVADWETVRGLRDDAGRVAAEHSEGHSSFPVWPHPRYVAACADHEWAGNAPAATDVHAFLAEWLQAMASDNLSLAVFPTPGPHGVIVSAPELAATQRRALARYE